MTPHLWFLMYLLSGSLWKLKALHGPSGRPCTVRRRFTSLLSTPSAMLIALSSGRQAGTTHFYPPR